MKKFFGLIWQVACFLPILIWKGAKMARQKLTAKKEKKPVSKFSTYLIGLLFNLVLIGIIFSLLIKLNITGFRLIAVGSLISIASLIYFGKEGVRKIEPVHVGVPVILGDISGLFLLPAGWFWILPKPWMDFVFVSVKEQTLDPKIKRVLSEDSMEAEVDVQIQYVITDPYLNQKVAESEKALTALAERNIRWLANMIVLEKLPSVKNLFSELLEGNATLETLKNHSSTNTARVEAEAIAELGVKDSAGKWGLTIKKAMVTDIRIPQNVADANAEREVEVAQRKSEGIQNRTLIELMKEFKADFPGLSDREIADLIQVERKKATRTIIDGSAAPIVQAGLLAGGGGKP